MSRLHAARHFKNTDQLLFCHFTSSEIISNLISIIFSPLCSSGTPSPPGTLSKMHQCCCSGVDLCHNKTGWLYHAAAVNPHQCSQQQPSLLRSDCSCLQATLHNQICRCIWKQMKTRRSKCYVHQHRKNSTVVNAAVRRSSMWLRTFHNGSFHQRFWP